MKNEGIVGVPPGVFLKFLNKHLSHYYSLETEDVKLKVDQYCNTIKEQDLASVSLPKQHHKALPSASDHPVIAGLQAVPFEEGVVEGSESGDAKMQGSMQKTQRELERIQKLTAMQRYAVIVLPLNNC